MTTSSDTRGRALLVAVTIVFLAAVSTLAIGATTGGLRHRHVPTASSCVVPGLPGTVVNVSLIDMSGMGAMMNGGQSAWRTWRPGMMRVVANPQTAAAGVVSLRVTNTGVMTHELVVLPLAAGQQVGTRAAGADGKVDEAGSMGEVSTSCGAGAGEGLSAGTTGWTTLTLPVGRYELLCNLPGHYSAGMYTELVVG